MHHVTTRSIAEELVFREGWDYATGIRILAELVGSGELACHAFCSMPTHFHVLGTFGDVSRAIHKLNRRYAVAFNRRYRRRGHVFDSPFSRTEITSELQFRRTARYIALNPPDHETWSYASYPGQVGLRAPFSFVDSGPILEGFGSVAAFRAFVDEGREATDLQLGSGFAGNRVGPG